MYVIRGSAGHYKEGVMNGRGRFTRGRTIGVVATVAALGFAGGTAYASHNGIGPSNTLCEDSTTHEVTANFDGCPTGKVKISLGGTNGPTRAARTHRFSSLDPVTVTAQCTSDGSTFATGGGYVLSNYRMQVRLSRPGGQNFPDVWRVRVKPHAVGDTVTVYALCTNRAVSVVPQSAS